MAKSHVKVNGVEHDSLLLLERPHPLSSQGSPGISVHREFAYETFEMSSPLPVGSNVSGNSLSLEQAIRENKVAIVRQYSQTGQHLNVADWNGFTALHHAARANQTEVVIMLLECQADINCQGQQSLTPLHVAVRYNSYEAVKSLMEYNADPSMKDADGATPLHFAARHGCVDMSTLLLSNILSSVNCPDNGGMTPFHLACASGRLELCELFLEHKANIRARTLEEKSPLHLAALHGNKDIVEVLIKEAFLEFGNPSCYIDAPDFEGNTALHLACQKGYKQTAELLLNQGADVVDGETDAHFGRHSPLHLAAAYGHVDVVELLISHGAPVDCRDESQRTPLQRAAEFDRVDTVKYLLKNGADIEAKDNENRTAFVLAVKRGRTRTAERLLDSGADFKSRDASLRTCLHLAVKYERVKTLRMLLERDQGQLINERDKDLQTPLYYAAHLGNLKILQLLMEKKCAVAPKDVTDRTPLHAAAEHGHVACVELLCLSEPGHINDKDERGLTPLHLAARESHRKTSILLLHMGANPSIRDSKRWTALHHCAAGGCARSTEALLVYYSALSIEAADQEGNTALHVAAKHGHIKVLELILSRGADITVRNKQMFTCLDVAIEYGKENVAEVIIESDKWMSLFQYTVNRGANPMKNLIKSMPRLAEVVMNKCVKYSDLPRDDPEYSVSFDFSLLAAPRDKEDPNTAGGPRFFGPSTMVEFERERLLMHPLSQALLQWKWITMGKPLYWLNFFTYFAFVALLTLFVVTERDLEILRDENGYQKVFRFRTKFSTGVPIMILIFIFLHMIKELYQITVQKWRYFTHLTNYTEWCCYITALCFVSPYIKGESIFRDSAAMWPLATIVILLSYTTLILFLRRFGNFGVYISMFLEVTRTLFKVLIIFIPVIFAFALSFFLLLKEQPIFNGLFWSFTKTFIMMIGEIDYGSIIVEAKEVFNEETGAPFVNIPEFSATIVCLFCVMVSVLVMNLLVGLAVGDIDSIQRDANMTRLAMQVEFATDVDQRLPRWLRLYCHRSVLVLKPNKKSMLSFMFRMNVRLFSMVDILVNGNNGSNVEEDESTNKVSMEIAKQREQINFLQKSVEEQSRLLQEISHQLKKQTARPTDAVLETWL